MFQKVECFCFMFLLLPVGPGSVFSENVALRLSSVLGGGRAEAERHSSSLVPGGRGSGAGGPCGPRPHQQAQCKTPPPSPSHTILLPPLCDWLTLSGAAVPRQEKKNGVELFVSSDRKGTLKPRPADEVIHSLDVGVLHRHLGHFGITEVSSEVSRGHRGHCRQERRSPEVLSLSLSLCVRVCACAAEERPAAGPRLGQGPGLLHHRPLLHRLHRHHHLLDGKAPC